MGETLTRSSVLLVDDERQIQRFLRPALEAAGYDVLGAETGGEALEIARQRAPDLILLDLGLPDIDGQEVLAQLRGFSQAPVVVLSARDRETEKIAALDGGADDYVEKPFALGELLARVRAQLRHNLAVGAFEPVRHGGLEIDVMKREVRLNGAQVSLSGREYALLALLAQHAGRVLTHRQLLTAVWGDEHTGDVQYLRVYIAHLRQKLGATGGRMIATEPGVGYRLVVPEE
ncbi:MAG TPA: response regulator transcription factor [Acetobacteraceae bacterium]|nr:response regulator transcription factor [Acetobacteraceae bacterium]